MQKDAHFYATLALCVRAGYSPEEAKLIAWANYMTDCTRLTQVKWSWQMWGKGNPGPWFHFIEHKGTVYEGSAIAADLVRKAETPIQLGIALHAFQDTSSHAGFVGRMDKRNVMGLGRGYWLLPPYGHAQLLRRPDRCEIIWTDSRTGEVRNNAIIFANCLQDMYSLVLRPDSPATLVSDIFGVTILPNYEARKAHWARLAGMPDIRFSEIKKEMWAKHKKEFKAAAKRQKLFLRS